VFLPLHLCLKTSGACLGVFLDHRMVMAEVNLQKGYAFAHVNANGFQVSMKTWILSRDAFGMSLLGFKLLSGQTLVARGFVQMFRSFHDDFVQPLPLFVSAVALSAQSVVQELRSEGSTGSGSE